MDRKSNFSNIIMTKRKPSLSTHDKIIRFIFGVIVFFGFVTGGTYYLQSSLLIFKGVGIYAHWGIILFLLPAISGLVQHLIDPPAKLVVAVLGALITSMTLYPLYSDVFWAIPPSITDSIVFTLVIAGIGFTCSINPLERHIHQRRSSKVRKKTTEKNKSHPSYSTHKEGSMDGLLNSSLIRTFELMLSILSFILAMWGTFILGSAAVN